MFKRPQKLPASVLERPQVEPLKLNLMARWWRSLTALSSRPFRASIWLYRPLLWFIKRLDKHYRALDDEKLSMRIEQLKRVMRRDGITNKHLVHAYALVREVAGRELGMWHFDSQILGGLAILHGNIGQMQTGEGKTLTATLPVATAALAGVPVHVVTVNDYLTARDAELMAPVYQRLGLSIGVVVADLALADRQQQYAKDIVYCTNNELAFDYLKDRIVLDEVVKGAGSALELHASRLTPTNNSDRTAQLMLRGLHFAVVDEADGVCMDEATTPLIISGEATPQPDLELMYQQAYGLISSLREGIDYRVTQQPRQVEITPTGEEKIENLTYEFGPLWRGRVRRLELAKQALTAEFLFVRDRHYLIDNGKVVIIDEHTGRRMPDRTWERGLHQLIELKEDCEQSPPRTTLASISFQNFFRLYHHLAGMTGTATEVKLEFWQVYELPVVSVPTHKRNRRRELGCRFFHTDAQKWRAVAERVVEFQSSYARPVLVGTSSLLASENLSQALVERGVDHQVLNARQDSHEAELIAQAGQPKQVTIATSMAGRGTDIKLADEVDAAGGLHVIITGLHESSRVDRQLAGRCARQGDRGSVELMLSLEDEVLSGWRLQALITLYFMPLPRWLKERLLLSGAKRCQSLIERKQQRVRKQLLKHDEQQQELLSFTGHRM